MPKGSDERKEILLNILNFLMSLVWQLQSMTVVSLHSYTKGRLSFHYIPAYTQIFSVSQEIWKVHPGRQSILPH